MKMIDLVLTVCTFNVHLFNGPFEDGDYGFWHQMKMLFFGGRKRRVEYLKKIKKWLKKRNFHIVRMQEVFQSFSFPGRRKRTAYFKDLGFADTTPHGVGARWYRFENLLLSRLQSVKLPNVSLFSNFRLKGRVYWLAQSGFTAKFFHFGGQIILVINTHLHPTSIKKRMVQAGQIVRRIEKIRSKFD